MWIVMIKSFRYYKIVMHKKESHPDENQNTYMYVRIKVVYINHRLSSSFVILFLAHNAVQRLPVLWTRTVQRDVLIFALDEHACVVLTRTPLVNEETTLTRLLKRRW